MLVLKLFVISGIIVICSYLGIQKAKTFEVRTEELKKIQSSLNMFKSKIEFTYEPIKDIFEEISKIVYQDKSNIFKNTINFLQENYEITQAWNMAIINTQNYLDTEDKDTLKLMGKLLGKTDKLGQISEINLEKTLLERQIEKAENEKNKNVKLYRTLGIVFGIGIVIIFI